MNASLRAPVRYLLPGVERPVYIASQGGADAAISVGAEFEEVVVDIADARSFTEPASLDSHGFACVGHITAVADFYQLDGFKSQYEAELREMVLALTGGKDCLVFDHTLRSDSPTVRGQRGIREPASVIHNDYTDASAEKRLRDLLAPDEADERLQSRYAVINVWRSAAGTIYHSPMAFCEADTIAPEDLVASERRAQERVGELELVLRNPAHRWAYFSELQPDEVLVFKTFDSVRDGRARRTVHTAFDNPLAPDAAPPRESIESRVLVFF